MKKSEAIKSCAKLLCAIACIQSIAYGQSQRRSVDKISWRTEPIKIQKIETRGTAIELGKEFVEDDNWLEGLKVAVKNASNKVITRIVLQLSFPRSADAPKEASTYVVMMIYGADPADKEFDVMKEVGPGELAEVKLVKSNVPLINKDLEDLGYQKPVKRAQLKVESVTFIDGSTWSGDVILYPDPKNPKNKINPRHAPMKNGVR